MDFLSVLPGRYRVSLGDNSWVGGTAFENATTYTVKAGETTKVEATPAEQTELLGYVSTDRGQVLRGALVLVHRMDDPKTIVASAVSFESPGFRIQGLPRTSYGITVIDPGGKYRTTTVDNVDPDFQVVTMPHSPKLATFDEHDSSATFTATGRGARAATYGVLYRADDGEAIASVAANPGAFDQHAPPGTYKVRIGEHSWYGGRSFATAKTITLRRGRTTHVALGGLPANGDLVGSAVTSSGLVLHRAFATIYAADNSHEVIGRVPVDGTFRFDGLPVRSYKIRISDPLGRFATRWFGGGGSFASARAVTPEVSEERLVGTTVLPVAFTVMKPPTITGTAKVGRRLTASDPTFSRAGASMSRLWYRDGRRIRGVTKTTYLLLAKDEGHRITVKVTARKQDEKTLVVSSKSTPRVAGR
ncbi:hypothetical protein [Aeromicrobium stalagmiti]|uniref:hypothetical protein n=1 Tax=Aeromicrobium stalagmiti TaxID=2738988 RepID=UPI00156930F9|nr:hypothetical protein [Aeromicrobium stalagmiti]NRQ49220.1 hypothetical protein [Aeromicrobium stalagmiti]